MWYRPVVGIVLAAVIAACTEVTEVSRPDLASVVERDAISFTVPTIPEAVLDRLASSRLVVIGETHLISEHRELVAALVEGLHVRGFRQVLLEWPHFADWILDDLVAGEPLLQEWEPPEWLYGDLVALIREFNRSLAAEDQVRVRGIDVNLTEYGGASSFRNAVRTFSQRLADPGPFTDFFASPYGTPEEQSAALQSLRAALEQSRSTLIASWGDKWLDRATELVEVEIASVGIRTVRTDRYDVSVRMRENVMKRLTDIRLEEHGSGTLLNVGSNHAQKSYLRGTEQEWLGDYLAHRSPVVAGAAIVLAVVPALISSGSTQAYNQLAESPPNELWRLMSETWPGKAVFLSLDDPVFETESVPFSFEQTTYIAAPKRHYDALVLLPQAHRIPIP